MMEQLGSATPPPTADSAPGVHYVLLYRPGPAWVAGVPVTEQALGPHRAYAQALFEAGRLVFAGPFLDDGGGVAVLNVRDRAEAERTLAADPAVASGVLVGEVRPCFPVVDGWGALAARVAGTDDAERNAETVRRLYAAVERRDGAAVWLAHDGAAVIHEAPSLPHGGEYRGADGVRRHAAGYVATWDPLQGEEDRRLAPEIIADGDRVAVIWRQRAWNPSTGERFDQPAVTIHRLVEGRVVESRMFHFDTHAVREFLNRSSSPAG
jgi:uncharacterized protein